MSRQARADIAPEETHGTQRSLTLTVGAALIFVSGLIAATTGVWFILGSHPFNGQDDYAEEFGMTRAEVDSFNPEISEWVLHVSDQVGAVSLGWGLFLMALAVLGVRHGDRSAWLALWIGALPMLLIAAFGELVMFGTVDTGSLLSLGVLLLFLVGMLLPVQRFRLSDARP